jgi:RND family efflux transporter MFP subunit
MEMDDISSKINTSGTTTPTTSRLSLVVFRIILPVAILVFGGLCAIYFLETKPKSKRQPPARQARLVEVVSIEPSNIPIKISAYGTVIAAQEVDLKPQVPGKIIELSPDLMRGGTFKKDQMLIKIEPDDYELLIQQRQSDVAVAESNLKLEHGNQAVAEQEYKLLEGVVAENDRDLVLRKPQLISSQSALQTAQAKLQQAEIDLKRTNITAPFNSVVQDKYIDLGAMVSQTTTLATLVGTDEYWVKAMVPVDALKWIKLPLADDDTGSQAKIYNSAAWADEAYRTGTVLRLYPDLETNGREAQLLISVKNPLLLNTDKAENRLLLNSYVTIEIQGLTVESVYVLDRYLLHDGDNIWLFTSQNTLAIQPVKVIYRRKNDVVISEGISAGDRIITTDLAAPVEGMALRLHSTGTDTQGSSDNTIQASSDSRTK